MTKFVKCTISLLLVFVLAFCPLIMQSGFAASIGDVNGDSKVNSVDALAVLQHSTKVALLSAEAQKVADVNWDGTINSSDALEILLVATGIKASFPKKPEKDPPASKSYEGSVTASSSLRLRSGAGTSYAILATIPYGTVVVITQEQNGWGKTTYNGLSGWVSLDYIKKLPSADNPGESGTFTITCYGWGHGVGLSQYGAITYAEQGWKYDQILLHYYHTDKTKMMKDYTLPATVKFNGQDYEFKRFMAVTTYLETGDFVSYESVKSMMVTIYTFLKYFNFNVSTGMVAFDPSYSYNYNGTAIGRAMNEALGEYVAYNGKPLLAVYCSSVGKKTTSSENAWASSPAPEYLKGGRVSPEPDSISKRVYTFTTAEIKNLAYKNMGVTLTGDPSKWFTDIVHDKSVDANTGYIASMKVGGKVIKGDQITMKLFEYKIRSHCINIKYNP